MGSGKLDNSAAFQRMFSGNAHELAHEFTTRILNSLRTKISSSNIETETKIDVTDLIGFRLNLLKVLRFQKF